MKKRSVFALFTGASAAALTLSAAPALAQQTEQPRSSGREEIVVTAQKRAQNIQDVPIAVTALSQNQLQQAGVADIRALQTVSASINLNSSQTESGGTTLRIRGVGTTGNNAGLESAVGVFLDGVYLSRPAAALGELFDVQQIEVLRGPQGTLFGRNTSAGALTIKTKAPEFNTWGGFANATVGAIEGGDAGSLMSSQAGVNIPLVDDKLAARIGIAARVRDGLLTSTSGVEQNSRDRYYIRGQLLFAPSEDLSVRVIGDFQKGKDNCCDAVIIRESPLVTAGAFALAGLGPQAGVFASGQTALENRISNSTGQFQDPGEQKGVSAEVNWDLDFANLTYLGSYRTAESAPNVQEDYVGVNVYSVGGNTAVGKPNINGGTTDLTSHELRLAGDTGRLKWLVGAYHSKEDIEVNADLTLGSDFQRYVNGNVLGLIGGLAANPATAALAASLSSALGANPVATLTGGASSTGAFAANRFSQDGSSSSVFTHNTLSVTDKLDVTLGARYVEETKKGKFVQLAASNPACIAAATNPLTAATAPVGTLIRGFLCFPFAVPVGLPGGPATFNREFKDNELVYTGNVGYKFTPDVKGYVSFTHGFKSGGFNLDPTAAAGGADPRFKSEKVDAWEVGLKADLLDGGLRVNTAIFSSEMQDFQVLEFTGVQFQTFNVPKVKADGAEVELSGRLTDALSTSLAVTYSNARYPSDCAPTTASLVIRTLCGSKLTNAPEWVGIFGLNYDKPVGASHRVFAAASVRYESDRRTSTQAYEVATSAAALRTVLVPDDIQDANSKTNLRIGYGAQNERWAVELWGTNIFNEQTRNVTFNTPLRGFNAATASRGAFLEEPAQYGVTLRSNF